MSCVCVNSSTVSLNANMLPPSIAAANTFTRNIYKEWLKPDATPRDGETVLPKNANSAFIGTALEELLTAPYTFMDARLAKYYGVPAAGEPSQAAWSISFSAMRCCARPRWPPVTSCAP